MALIDDKPDQKCRNCGDEGWGVDEFLSPYNGLCGKCQPQRAAVTPEELLDKPPRLIFNVPENPKEITGQQKPALAMIPSGALIPICGVLSHGEAKYGPYNWRDTPVQAMTYVHAIVRHLYAYIDGEDVDQESGESHLAHIAAGCCIALDAASVGHLNDNRPARGRAAELIRATCVTSSGDKGGRKRGSVSRTTSAGVSGQPGKSKSTGARGARNCSTR